MTLSHAKTHRGKKVYPLTSLGILSFEVIAAPLLAAAYVGDARASEVSWLIALLASAGSVLHVLLARLRLFAVLAGSVLGMLLGVLTSWVMLQRAIDGMLIILSLNITFYWVLGIVLGALAQYMLRLRRITLSFSRQRD